MQRIRPAPPVPELTAFESTHLDGALALSRQAGWPHRREDWAMALHLSRGLVALGEDGTVAGTVFVTPYGGTCATINMVIVDAARRGQGLGRRLMQAALDIAGDRSLRLVATTDGLPLYEKLGFRIVDRVVQHQGRAAPLKAPEGVAAAVKPDLAAFADRDAQAFGADRSGLIRALAEVGRFAEIGPDGAADAGFAALRPFGRGEVIGPVVATCATDAQALIGFWIAERPGAFLRVDTYAAHGLSSWLSLLGLADVGGGIAMRRDSPAHPARPSRFSTYALANQAFG